MARKKYLGTIAQPEVLLFQTSHQCDRLQTGLCVTWRRSRVENYYMKLLNKWYEFCHITKYYQN